MIVDIHRVINSNFYKKVGCARTAGIGWKFCVFLFLVFELVPNVPKAKKKYMCISGFPTLPMFLARP